MFVNNDIPENRRMLGFYEVNGNQYLNKYHALQQCKNNEWLHWNFHDEAFSQVNWAVEPEEDLYELYLQRAIQLRVKYDKLVLFYSGGIDSHTLLNVFLKNNIKLDAVITTGSYSIDTNINTTCNQEQRRVAHPYIEELKKKGYLKDTQVLFVDTVDFHRQFAETDESWVFQCGQSITPQVFTYNYYWQDPQIQAIMNSGKTAFIRGIDKPRVILDNGDWYLGFIDYHIMSGTPTGMLNKNQDWDIQEYFFWTPDFTKILQKQVHTLINYFEQNLTYEQALEIATKDSSFKRSKYNNYVDPIIYYKESNQGIGNKKDYFSLGKPEFTNLWHKDYWMFEAKDQFAKEISVWEAGLHYLKDNTPDHVWNKSSTEQTQKLEKLIGNFGLNESLLDVSHILEGVVGSWSKFHYIRKANFKVDNR
jgi:hypothetical protein